MPELFSRAVKPATKRYQVADQRNHTAVIADQTLTRKLRKLTPMVMNTTNSKYQPWIQGVSGNGTDKIVAFIDSGPLEGEMELIGEDYFDTPAEQISGEETTCVLMLAGILHFDDIEALYLDAGNTVANLKTALALNPLVSRFQIQGLEDQYWVG